MASPQQAAWAPAVRWLCELLGFPVHHHRLPYVGGGSGASVQGAGKGVTRLEQGSEAAEPESGRATAGT